MTNPPRKDIHNSDTPVLCRSCEARHKGMCGVLQPEELLALARHTRVVRHEAGAELAAESMPVESYANVMRGVVKLSKAPRSTRTKVFRPSIEMGPKTLGSAADQNIRGTPTGTHSCPRATGNPLITSKTLSRRSELMLERKRPSSLKASSHMSVPAPRSR